MLKHICNDTTKSKIFGYKNEDVQPNALDIRIGKIFVVDPFASTENGQFMLDGDTKKHSAKIEIRPDADGFYNLQPNQYYSIEFLTTIKVAEGEAGWVLPRSTLMRNGIVLFTCLYDSGYGMNNEFGNPMVGSMYVFNPHGARIRENERVGQYICVDAECRHLYNGSYQ